LLARSDGNLGILSGGLTTDGVLEILLNVLDTVVLLVRFVILLGRSYVNANEAFLFGILNVNKELTR
jgi:hypothetical protein